MKVVRVYGSYLGEKKLAWIGFEDRVELYFKKQGKYLVRIIPTPEWDWTGWDNRYQIGA